MPELRRGWLAAGALARVSGPGTEAQTRRLLGAGGSDGEAERALVLAAWPRSGRHAIARPGSRMRPSTRRRTAWSAGRGPTPGGRRPGPRLAALLGSADNRLRRLGDP